MNSPATSKSPRVIASGAGSVPCAQSNSIAALAAVIVSNAWSAPHVPRGTNASGDVDAPQASDAPTSSDTNPTETRMAPLDHARASGDTQSTKQDRRADA